jgi:N-hydroxyarylamine O-acetyltransferase
MAWLDSYFERINYNGPTDVSLETLRQLHMTHAFNIPFENLDIHMGRKIVLTPEAFIDKLIVQRRGGYCYEMNGLFSLALEELGFKFDRLSGRIKFGYPNLRPRTHQISIVYLDGKRWIADVSYGAHNLIAPMPFIDGHNEQQFTEQFRISKVDDRSFMLQGLLQGEWQNFYHAYLEPQLPIDFTLANWFNSTSPESGFVQRRITNLPTRTGRISMINDLLKIVENGVTTEIYAQDLDHYLALLKQYFGIELEPSVITFPPRSEIASVLAAPDTQQKTGNPS